MPLPADLAEDAEEGFSRSVNVEITNEGEVPVAVTQLRVEGVGDATRRLALPFPDRPGFLRAFGFLPPGESVRYRLGVSYPRAGCGSLRLLASVRLLPRGTAGKVMEEVVIPANATEAEHLELRASTEVSISPRTFDRQTAKARALASLGPEARVRAAAYSRTLGGWVLEMDEHTLLATPTETRNIDGLSLAAVRVMDHYEDAVPVLDSEGRLRRIPRGPLLRVLIDESQARAHTIDVTEYAPGKEALLVH